MKCPVCNATTVAGATFCQQCGAKLPALDAGDMGRPVGTSTTDPRRAARENQSSAEAESGRGMSSSGRRIVDVPEEILKDLKVTPVSKLDEVIQIALVSAPVPLNAEEIAEEERRFEQDSHIVPPEPAEDAGAVSTM